MPETSATRKGERRLGRLTQSISAKLILLCSLTLLIIFGLLGYLSIRLHRKHLEAAVLGSAERISDVIHRSTSYYMLRNDRDGLYQVMKTIADEPGMVRVRVFDQEGRISYSTDLQEVTHVVDKNAEACYGCHAQSQPLVRLQRPDRFRIYRDARGARVLGIITPIENRPSCSNSDCHAHPASQAILGVLDTNLSLARADTQLAEGSWRMLGYTVFAMLTIALLIWLFVWRVVARPLQALEAATQNLAEGHLGVQIAIKSQDEIGELANSFNSMSRQLQAANEEIVAWTKTLEERVEQKTSQLQRAHEQVLHAEKMASIGKMAAVVAHEINNPLFGILTYAKLIKKWLAQGEISSRNLQEANDALDLVATESRRCGDLVKSLLAFSRTSAMHVEPTDLNEILRRSVRLVQHKLEMGGVQVQFALYEDLPAVECDPAQIEQVFLALMINAMDAMPRGGNLLLATNLRPDSEHVQIEIRDDGAGIPPDILSQIFEPFVTTKETGHGVGLGLAISQGIVERHHGRIEVESEVGRGTTFRITLPVTVSEVERASIGTHATVA
jgi:two-component system, NtrC family, sensor kinase